MPALHAVGEIKLHIVAQVVEAELVVGAVGDIGGIGFAPLAIVEIVHDDADRQAEEGVKLAHPFRVALGQVVVDRDHVDAAPGKRIEVNRQGGNQRFTFAGLHFSDLALVQHHATDQLHVEVAHLQHAPTRLARHRKRLGKDLVQHQLQLTVLLVGVLDCIHALADAPPEFFCLGLQLLIAELLRLGLERIDALHQRHNPLDFPFVASAKNFGDKLVDQRCVP